MSAQITPPLILLPEAQRFALRSKRLTQLAEGHSQAAWLRWLAALCDAQQRACGGLPDVTTTHAPQAPYLTDDTALLQTAAQVCRNLLSTTSSALAATDDDIHSALRDSLHRARESVLAERWDVLSLTAAAALQVVWSDAARKAGIQPAEGTEVAHDACPCCGSLPVGSIIMAGDGKAGVRYLECSLCATRWHAVRAHCTLCDSGRDLTYFGLEDHYPAVQAEACADCHGYLKVYQQMRDIHTDPTADDLASLALDVLVGEHGFGRACPNLLMNDGEALA